MFKLPSGDDWRMRRPPKTSWRRFHRGPNLPAAALFLAMMTGALGAFGQPSDPASLALGSGDLDEVVLQESFESGVMPPQAWSLEVLDLSATWEITDDSPHSGSFAAQVPRDQDPFAVQNEFLLSPEVLLTEGELAFWSRSDLYWCRDVLDNCDLLVWLVVGDLGGSDDVLLGRADPDWLGSEIWSRSRFDLTPFLPQPPAPVRVAFNYLAWDARDRIGLDDVQIESQLPADVVFGDGFESGGTLAWSETVY